MRTLSLHQARRFALTAQGFARGRPPPDVRRDVRHLRRVLRDVDVVQLDSVNVLARAHELPFWSRLGPHDRAARDRWLWRSRELYEGWIHVASMTSVDAWPLLAHRREHGHPYGRAAQLLRDDPGYVAAVRAEVARNGPTSVRDLPEAGARRGPWWGDPRGKVALEALHHRGVLAMDHRATDFTAHYDLTERVIPASARDAEVPPRAVAVRELIARAAQVHPVATVAELADHHRLPVREARVAVDELVAAGRLDPVRVTGADRHTRYLAPDASTARRVDARALLSPFDPLVWHRDRTEALHGFRYRIEIYVPAAKRVHGYYVLPFLLGDRLVARVDLKAVRREGRLRVAAAHAEPGVDRVHVAAQLAAELRDLASWLGLADVEVVDRGDLAGALADAV